MVFIPEIETKSEIDIKTFQEGKLREVLSYLQNHSKFYKKDGSLD